jgi:hypothetical protein
VTLASFGLSMLEAVDAGAATAAEFATIWVWNWQSQDIKRVANITSLQTLEKIKCQLIKRACGNLLMAF